MSEVKFQHTDAMSRLLYELCYINERIMTGDICSAKTAMPKCIKLCIAYKKEFIAEGCVSIDLEPYQAHGGWIGLRYSYCFEDGVAIQGGQVPRRIEK